MKNVDAGAIFNEAGQLLWLKQEHMIDAASFYKLFLLGRDVFRLSPGDGFLTNDAFAGASFFSQPSLVYRSHLSNQSCYFVQRIGLKNFLPKGARIEDEGFRIPPTPLISSGELNADMFATLSAIDQLPRSLFAKLKEQFLTIKRRSEHLVANNSLLFSENELALAFQKKLAELPHGTAKTEAHWDNQGKIRLQTTISEEGIVFDFSGTSLATHWGLTDTATLGVCVNFAHRLLLDELAISSKSFQHIHVNTPVGSLVAIKQPISAYRGLREGVYRLTQVVFECVNKILHQRKLSFVSPAPVWIQLDFTNSQLHFYDSIPSGSAASKTEGGENSLDAWARQPVVNSIEQIENLYPLRIHRTEIRKNSGGSGSFQGGHGMLKEYELLAEAHIRGILASHIGNGEPAIITIQRPQDKKALQVKSSTEVANLSTEVWPEKTRIVVMSAGGAGYNNA